MLSVVIPTSNDEQPLVRTLAMLVPAAMSGIVKEVIVADRQSSDATIQAADAAGCTIIASDAALAARLASAAEAARASWLLFLRPGVVLEPSWAEEASRFVQDVESGRATLTAAAFSRTPGLRPARSRFAELLAALRTAFAANTPRPDQGLLVSKTTYRHIGGHRGGADPEADLVARIGKRRVAVLRSGAEI